MVPKGVLVMGVSGCGKSLSIKAGRLVLRSAPVSHRHGEIFSDGHGSPEWAFADACRMVEAVAPAVCVVRRDRARHHLGGEHRRAGPHFSRSSSPGCRKRCAGLFVAATANRIDLLPAR